MAIDLKKYYFFALLLQFSASFAQSHLTNLGTTSTLFIGSNFTLHCDGNVTNETGATLQFSAGSSSLLEVEGDFTNSTSGILTAGLGTISFTGAAAQNADFGGDNLYNLKISNTSGDVTLTRAATVTNNLNFTSGDLVTTAVNILNLTAAATATGAADGNHVNGPMNKTTASTSTFTFPVGNGSRYRPCAITPAATSATTWYGHYHDAPYTDLTFDNTMNHLGIVEYWTLSRTAGAADGTVTLSWDAISDVNELSSLITAYYNAGDWTNSGGNNITGTTAAGTLESNAWTSWSGTDYWTLATTGIFNPLPVELLFFNAEKNDNKVQLHWKTATEINSNYFEVLHSINGIQFETFTSQPAAGNSNTPQLYFTTHENPSPGINYYQLKEVDKDGQSDLSSIISINFNTEENSITQLYPNPSPGNTTLYFNSSKGGIYLLNIINQDGKLLYNAIIPAHIGENKFALSLHEYNNSQFHIVLIDPNNNKSSISFIKQ